MTDKKKFTVFEYEQGLFEISKKTYDMHGAPVRQHLCIIKRDELEALNEVLRESIESTEKKEPKTFKVLMKRVSYAKCSFIVDVPSGGVREAVNRAYDMAGDYTYKEKDCRYELEEIEPIVD